MSDSTSEIRKLREMLERHKDCTPNQCRWVGPVSNECIQVQRWPSILPALLDATEELAERQAKSARTSTIAARMDRWRMDR